MHVPLARLETRYTDGRYQSGKTTIIVAGIGYSVVPFRYAAPGSIEIIDLALCPLESLSRRIPRVGQRIDPVHDRADDLLAFYLRHPWLLQISQARPVLGPNEFVVRETVYGIVSRTGMALS